MSETVTENAEEPRPAARDTSQANVPANESTADSSRQVDTSLSQPEAPPRRSAHADNHSSDEVHFSFLKHVILPGVILALGVGGLIASSWLKEEPPRVEKPPFIPEVTTVPVERFAGALTLNVDGQVVPLREVSITSEIGGRIASKNPRCRAGNYVAKGTLLFEVDSEDYQLEVKRLKQEVAQAEIGIREIDVQLTNYRQLLQLAAEDRNLQLREVQRLQGLVSERVVTESELDKARGTEVTKRNSLQTLANEVKMLVPRRASTEATLALAKTRLEKAQLDLSRTKIKAPIGGVVVDDMVEVNSFVARGATLTSIEDTSAIEVSCNLRSDQLFWLWDSNNSNGAVGSQYEVPQANASVIYRLGGREYEWDAVLSRFEGGGLDERTRTVPCRLLVSRPTEVRIRNDSPGLQGVSKPPALVRGMFVSVEIETDTAASLLKVPLEARQLGGTVWRALDEKLEILPVKIVRQMADAVLIESQSTQIRPDDRLITTPIAKVEDGMPIRMADDDNNPPDDERSSADSSSSLQPAADSGSELGMDTEVALP